MRKNEIKYFNFNINEFLKTCGIKTSHVYMFKNNIDDKVYIGETSRLRRRLRDHLDCVKKHKINPEKTQQVIHKAIAKHGIDNFTFYILESFYTPEEALKAEPEYIKLYKSNCYKYGYNSTPGGEGFSKSINRKLKNKDIRSIFNDYLNKMSLTNIALKYNVSRDVIGSVLSREHYAEVKIPKKVIKLANERRTKRNQSKKTTPEIIENIKKDALLLNNRDLANKYSLSIKYIRDIIKNNIKIDNRDGKNNRFIKNMISLEEVSLIINDYLSGNFSVKELSVKYNLTIDIIRDVLAGTNIKGLKIHSSIFDLIKNIAKKYMGQKLNENIIKEIFNKYATGTYTMSGLAKEFGLKSIGTIQFILSRETWSQVKIEQDILDKVNLYFMNNKYYYNKQLKKFILKSETLNNILSAILELGTLRQAAIKYNITPSFLNDILKNGNWGDVEVDKDILDRFLEKYKIHYSNFRKMK